MEQKKSFRENLDNIPNFVLNFVAIVSGVITIITPILTFVGVINTEDNEKKIKIAFMAIIILALAMLLLMYRYILKYKKLLLSTRVVTNERYHNLATNFRDTFFSLTGHRKNGTLTVDLLTSEVDKFLKQVLDDLCEIFNKYTCRKICACIKYIDGNGDKIDIETATIRTFVRSTNTDNARYDNDVSDDKVFIKDNTDYYSILSPNGKNYFYIADLLKYAAELRKNGDSYVNTTKNWDVYYRGTIVVPIRIANSKLPFTAKEKNYNVIGFLCLDTLATDAFVKESEKYYCDIAKGFAAEIFVILNQYRYYLEKLTKGEMK